MGINYNTTIVRSGLVLHLDAANPKIGGLTSVETLVVAGGGGGGGVGINGNAGGGGGAGGLLVQNMTISQNTNYTITVGSGGTSSSGAAGTSGTNSSISSIYGSIIAIGGGGGPTNLAGGTVGIPGGSGSGSTGTGAGIKLGGAGVPGQGNNGGGTLGGGGNGVPNYPSAGGGGAGTVGQSAIGATTAGAGGDGLLYARTGLYYAGGGGGATYCGGIAGAGGIGGGGSGGVGGSNGTSGTPNTGGGGGAAGSDTTLTYVGGNGGSGVVIVCYNGLQKATGGTITKVGNDTVHTFTASGVFTPIEIVSGNTIIGLTDLKSGIFGTSNNTPKFDSSNGGILTFNGSNNYISLGSSFGGLSIFTWDIWFKTTSVVSKALYYQASAMMGTVQGNGLTNDASLVVNNGKLGWFDEFAGAEKHYAASSNAVNDNKWHNAVVVRNGTSLSFYVDGIFDNSTTTGSNPTNLLGFELAKSNWTDNTYFVGSIGSVKIYNRTLSALEISQNFDALRGRYGI